MAAEVEPLVDSDDPALIAVVQDATSNLPADPYERAQERLSRLQKSFASSLVLVAEMYRDRDWEYLTREDGTPYVTLAEVFSDVLHISLSMARRYVQGARDFYIPLSEITVDGTRIEITSGEVAELGSAGLADAVDIASGQLDGVSDPEQAHGIIGDAVKEARSKKSGSSDDDWDDDQDAFADEAFEGFDPPSRSGSEGTGSGAQDDYSGLPDDDDDDDDWDDGQAAGTSTSSAVLDDPVERVLDGASDYSDPEALSELEEPLRSLAAALVTLAEMNPEDMAKIVAFDSRGVLVPVSGAISNATRFRALVETRPWYVSRLGA